MSFNQFNLDPRLLPGIARAGYTTPTPIQSAGIPAVLSGKDIIATAQTGTGKTAVFVLPILHKLLARQRGNTRALIVTPTRELAEQINDTICELGAGMKIRSATIYGGVGAAPQLKALREGVDILVACPGRLLDHIEHRHANLSALEVLVLDEADRMFDMGFLPSIRKIMSHIPKERQTLMFSATFPPEIEYLAAQALHNPQKISIGLERPVETVTHALFPVSQNLKTPLLLELLKQTDTESVLIFTRTKHRAQRLAEQIERTGRKVTSLHSDRSQGQRQSALNGFKDGRYQIMVATDIAARGLDVESISHVINYDMPDTPDAYIHRIGRTGRAERTGDAFTLATPEDGTMVRTLEKIMGQSLPRETLPSFDYGPPVLTREVPVGVPARTSQQRSAGYRPQSTGWRSVRIKR
ncbi:MAG: DEAD/DEAH box helicase [Dehalococcoidia bacterium]|nr:DEAD/DEAH box helicase [Dehalococcoidia bacterium]